MSNNKKPASQNQGEKLTKKEKLAARRQERREKEAALAAKKARNRKISIGVIAAVVFGVAIILLAIFIPKTPPAEQTDTQNEQNTEAQQQAEAQKGTKTGTVADADGNWTPEDTGPVAEITMADGGKIDVELDRNMAPKAVDNFVKLIEAKYYDGKVFHRIIKDFMIQAGSKNGDGLSTDDEEKIEGEFAENGVNNPLAHDRGIISMARGSDNNSAAAQFFITTTDKNKEALDGKYAAFGRVIKGMDIVDKLASVKVKASAEGEQSTPEKKPVIKSIRIIKK